MNICIYVFLMETIMCLYVWIVLVVVVFKDEKQQQQKKDINVYL